MPSKQDKQATSAPIRFAYQRQEDDANGNPYFARRIVTVPDGRVIGQNLGSDAYFPLEGVTLEHGAFWHWEPTAAAEAVRIRILDPDEIAARTKDGVFESGAYEQPDMVTGISVEDLQQADAPIPQTALPEEES